jgi:hypothetical protein
MRAELLAAAQQQLAADADAEQRFAFGDRSLQRRFEPALAQSLHGIPEGADAREDDAIGLRQRLGFAGNAVLHAKMTERLSEAEQIAAPVVDHRDQGRVSGRTGMPASPRAALSAGIGQRS